MTNLLQACRTLIAEAYHGRNTVSFIPAKFAAFQAAVEETSRLIDPTKAVIIMPESAWWVLSETLALDTDSAHIEPALREEIQAALETIETVQLLETPATDEEAAAAFELVTDALALSAEVTP